MSDLEHVEVPTIVDDSSNSVLHQMTEEDPPTNELGFRERWRTDAAYKKKIINTVWLGMAYGIMGLEFGVRGPSFLDLQLITNTDEKTASFFFTAASLGMLIGSLVSGIVYERLNKTLVVLLSLLGMGVSTVAVPWCSMYPLMVAMFFVMAVFSGFLDTVCNAEVVALWGKSSEVPMQFLHFSFALGGIISPLFTEPFLTPLPDDPQGNGTSNTSAQAYVTNASAHGYVRHLHTGTGNDTGEGGVTNITARGMLIGTAENKTGVGQPLTTDVHYAYLICGSLAFFAAAPFAVELVRNKCKEKPHDSTKEEREIKQPLPPALFIFVTAILCFFYFIYCCVDDTFASFLAIFVVKQLHWSKSAGAQISSVFWASFAIGRFLSIFLIKFLTSMYLIVLCCLSLILSLLGLYLFAQHQIDVGVWVSAIMASLSMGPIFAAGFTWAEEELMRVTGLVVSLLIVASALGNMVNPPITGFLMQEQSPMWFSYLLFAESILCLFVFLFLIALARWYVHKHYNVSKAKTLECYVTVPVKEDAT